MSQISPNTTRTLNFFQAVGATLKTVPGSMGTLSSVGTFLYAWVNAPITSYIQLVAGIISLSNETKVRLAEKNIAYKSIIDHVSDGAKSLKKSLHLDAKNPIEYLPASWQTLNSRTKCNKVDILVKGLKRGEPVEAFAWC